MNSRFLVHASASFLFLVGAVFSASGCSDGASTDSTAAGNVDVPEVPASVASEDFCALFDEVRCAGALGCCEASQVPFADEAECLAASTCEADIAAVLASPLVADGTVVYDAIKAADYLQTRATSTSACGAAKDDSSPLQVFAGTLAAGADCSANATDIAHAYVCKSGLSCDVSEDPATGAEMHACKPAAAVMGGFGDACKADEDCESGLCVTEQCDAEASALFCQSPPEPEPPPNWSSVSFSDAPQALRVTAHSNSGSGTSDDIVLAYRNSTATYSCTITASIATGGSQECVPTQSSTTTASTDYFYAKYADKNNSYNYDDGLRVTELAAKYGGSWYTVSKFNVSDTSIDCEGCTDIWQEKECNSCWIDGDGHGSCKEMKVKLDGNSQVWCI